MNEDYCDYKLSLALKAAGFDEPCDHFYEHRLDPSKARISASGVYGEWNNIDAFKHNFNAIDDNRHNQLLIPYCSAPTLWQAQKWLRDRKGIAINVDAHDGDFYTWEAVFLSNASQDVVIEASLSAKFSPYVEKLGSYEAALSAGISAALELIKKGE